MVQSMMRQYPRPFEPMQGIRPRTRERCPHCSRYAYSNADGYCMSCGHSERSPILGVLLMVFVGLAVLTVVGWLMS